MFFQVRNTTLAAGDQVEVFADVSNLAPRCTLQVTVYLANGDTQVLQVSAAIETQFELELLKAGGVIPFILAKTIRENAVH